MGTQDAGLKGRVGNLTYNRRFLAFRKTLQACLFNGKITIMIKQSICPDIAAKWLIGPSEEAIKLNLH